MNRYATQGRLLIDRLRRRPHTYLEMLSYGLSTSPWKRIAESLGPLDHLVKARDGNGRMTWRVIRATKWTA